MLSRNGDLFNIIESGARILESACGPCIGMGQSPKSGAVSLRTFNRNFEGRSGTKDAKVYLCSPETALAAALTGEITDPSQYFDKKPQIKTPEKFLTDDAQFQQPATDPAKIEVIKGPNIVSLKQFNFDLTTDAVVALKVGGNISTDHILPAGAKILPFRSNLPKISEFTYAAVDPEFAKRASSINNGVIVGGENYGQGSSREHAALAPRFLNIKMVLAKSFARIHLANLINFGIIPLTFENPSDYDKIEQSDNFSFSRAKDILKENRDFDILIAKKGIKIKAKYDLTPRQKEILLSGGLLNWIKLNGAQV
jgi:aconitate hydratase